MALRHRAHVGSGVALPRLAACAPVAPPPAASPTEPESSAALEAQARLERTAQVQRLFEEHAAFVWRALRRVGVPQADLEDATQEVFMVVYRRWDEYEERATVRAWLHAICVRIAHNQRRRSARRQERSMAEPPDLPVAAVQQQELELREAYAFGAALLAELPQKQRVVFELYEIEHLPMPEVARAVGCPLQTAYSRLHKARERMLVEVRRAERAGRLP